MVSLDTLVHLDLSQNNIVDAFSDLVSKNNMFVNLEIRELEDCFLSPSNFVFVLSFIKILQLIQLRLEVLVVFSKIVCDCTAVLEAETVQIVPKRNDGAGRKEQVYLLEDMLTKVELKHLVKAGYNVMQDLKIWLN